MRIAIYTALTGEYDNLNQPYVADSDFSFICFTDIVKEMKVGVWEMRTIPYSTNSKKILSRYPKMHPQELLEEFDYSVYIDANIEILNDSLYKSVKDLIDRNVILAGMKHQEVQCAYIEGLRILTTGKEKSLKSVIETLRFLKRQGFPYDYGMYEANVIFRNHHVKRVIDQCEYWWQCYLRFVKRDQITYPYTLWKFDIPFNYILPEQYSANNHSGFFVQQSGHGRPKSTARTFIKKIIYPPTIWFLKRYIELTKNAL